jgi:hypothetical protein
MSKLAFRAQTVDIAYLPLRQGFLGFPFGQQPVRALHKHWVLPLPSDKTAEGARRFMFNCFVPFLSGLMAPHLAQRKLLLNT